MKRFSVILAALALVVLMQGCGKGVEPETPNNPVQLRLKGNISAIAPSTRVNADGFEADDKVGVYVSATGSLTESGNMLDNEAFTYTGGNLTAPEGKEVYWGTPDVRLSVWAYYPYATNVENLAEYPFAVATDQKDEADYYNSDFITAQAANLAPQAEAVNLTFNHSLSKIAIILKNGTGITSEELASAEKSLSIDGVIVDGAIDLADGTATTGSTEATITPYAFDGLNYAAIVYPQQSEITFRIELGDDVYIYSTEVDYAAGTQYKYTFTIDTRNPQGMTLASTTISDWTDDENPTEETLSDIITFTDPKFKEYLLQEYLYQVEFSRHDNGDPHWVATPIGRIDANNDGEISIAEAEKVEYINTNDLNKLNGLGIRDMSELHFFLNLKILYCHSNELTTLDVSKNTALKWLYCINNQLGTLDVSNNTALEVLHCNENQLTSLDVSKNTALEVLHCNENQLTSLDVSKNTALTDLNCWENQLTTLDVSNNTVLTNIVCSNNQLTSLDVTSNTALTFLSCSDNQLTTLDVSNNTALTELYCYINQLTSLDVSNNTALVYLNCGENSLNTLDVSNNTALRYLHCGDNQLTSLDVSKNTALTGLTCLDNQLTSLDISNNTALTDLYCVRNQLTSLDVSNNTALIELTCYHNQLTTLDVSKNTALRQLWCENNQLTTLDVSNNTSLEDLRCASNQLTILDVSNNTALTHLSCASNQLTTLDVSNNTALTELYCYINQLTSLDVSKNTALTYLNCRGNQLTSLDVSKNTALTSLRCTPMNDAQGNNLLEKLYLATGQEIESLDKPEETVIEEK